MQVLVSVLPVFYSTRLFLCNSHPVRFNGLFDLTVFFPKFRVPLNRAGTVKCFYCQYKCYKVNTRKSFALLNTNITRRNAKNMIHLPW